IDNATYAELIAKVQQEPIDSEWFEGDAGAYIFAALRLKVQKLIQQEQVSFKYLSSSSASA
ncbi:MAG TPA: hypothetical protein VF443_06270, partial [Nitrospira sp.]